MNQSDEEQPKKFHIQKKRLGEIRYVRDDGEFGFIDAEDFREDVFFHRTTWSAPENKPPQEKMLVEFELDDEHLDENDQLRAKAVRLTRRPGGKKMSGRDAPHLINLHHPNARQKRPSWRNKS